MRSLVDLGGETDNAEVLESLRAQVLELYFNIISIFSVMHFKHSEKVSMGFTRRSKRSMAPKELRNLTCNGSMR